MSRQLVGPNKTRQADCYASASGRTVGAELGR